MNKCFGCGSNIDLDLVIDKIDFNETKILCQRCFRMKNYGEYATNSDIINFEHIFSNINKSSSLVVYVADIMNLSEDIINNKFPLNNKILLVLSKADLLPKSVRETKILNWIKSYNLNIIDTVLVSSHTNYNMDLLYSKLIKYYNNNDIYIVGTANVGKSTLINKMIKNYSNTDSYITTSPLPSTTLDIIKIKLNDKITLIDTPGIIELDNILNNVTVSSIKKIVPKKEIKPRTFQVREGQAILADEFLRMEYENNFVNSFTMYISNSILVNSVNKNKNNNLKHLKEYKLHIKDNQDIIIKGLCFIKVVKECDVTLYTIDNAKVEIRNKMI